MNTAKGSDTLESGLETTPRPTRCAKLQEWLRRYGPAELVGTAAAYVGFFVVQDATTSEVMAAYAGMMGENVGFYGTMIVREVVGDIQNARQEEKRYGVRPALQTAGKLVTEFGPAEALDSLVVRPATMGLGSRYLGRELGVAAGKIAADVVFYILTISLYEQLKKHL